MSLALWNGPSQTCQNSNISFLGALGIVPLKSVMLASVTLAADFERDCRWTATNLGGNLIWKLTGRCQMQHLASIWVCTCAIAPWVGLSFSHSSRIPGQCKGQWTEWNAVFDRIAAWIPCKRSLCARLDMLTDTFEWGFFDRLRLTPLTFD